MSCYEYPNGRPLYPSQPKFYILENKICHKLELRKSGQLFILNATF